MNKAEFARKRNWQKAQLAGFGLSNFDFVLSEKEKQLVLEMEVIKDKLLAEWDETSVKVFGMKVDRFDVTIYSISGQQFFHKKSKHEADILTAGLDKSEYKLTKL